MFNLTFLSFIDTSRNNVKIVEKAVSKKMVNTSTAGSVADTQIR